MQEAAFNKDLKEVHLFVIATSDYHLRYVHAKRAMKSLVLRMVRTYGSRFWRNAMLVAAGSHTEVPSFRKRTWTETYNRFFQREFSLGHDLPSAFIDSYYDRDDKEQVDNFRENVMTLLKVAHGNKPVHTKKIYQAHNDFLRIHRGFAKF